jgi:hypothetical protein
MQLKLKSLKNNISKNKGGRKSQNGKKMLNFQMNFIVIHKNEKLLLTKCFPKMLRFYLILQFMRDMPHLNLNFLLQILSYSKEPSWHNIFNAAIGFEIQICGVEISGKQLKHLTVWFGSAQFCSFWLI